MKSLPVIFFTMLIAASGYAQNIAYNNSNGTAIGGYDPVAYFLQNKAAQGSETYSTNWSGSKWNFISQANLDSFKSSPEKYAPQYGGYCAYGCSQNHKSPTDPTAWEIVGNKLYLNYNSKVKEFWLKENAARIKTADENWQVLKSKNE